MSQNLLQQSGAQAQKQPRYVPIFISDTFTGLYTQRSPLHTPADLYTKAYLGGRPDALWMGLNVELTNNLTLKRRPGLSPLSVTTYPTLPLRSYSFQLTDGTIRLIVDTSSLSFPVSSVANSSGGTAVYTGNFNSITNDVVGLKFNVTGFTNPANRGVFVCTASTATTLT